MRSLPGWHASSSRRQRAAVFLVALLLAVGVLSVQPPIAAADDIPVRSDAQKVAVFEDVTIGPDEVWGNVVVVGGDVEVQGTIAGVLVVVGGDLVVGPQAVIGARSAGDDAALVSIFGDIAIEPGGRIAGRTVDVAGSVSGALRGAIVDPVMRTWSMAAVINWVWSTVLLLVAGIVIAAIAPRQLVVVGERVRHRFVSSLGWGALGMIVVVPVATAFLIVTVIGIILAVPWVTVGLPIMSLFGLAAVGLMLGRLVTRVRGHDRAGAITATVIGLVVVSAVRWIPFAGAALLILFWLTGFGATYVSVYAWLRDRRAQRLETAPPRANGVEQDA